MNKNILKRISEKEMDRKDFLKYSGLVLLGVVGLKSLAALLLSPGEAKVVAQPAQQPNRHGFGSGKYGV